MLWRKALPDAALTVGAGVERWWMEEAGGGDGVEEDEEAPTRERPKRKRSPHPFLGFGGGGAASALAYTLGGCMCGAGTAAVCAGCRLMALEAACSSCSPYRLLKNDERFS